MGDTGRASHAAQKAKGKAKQWLGDKTGDKSQEAEGRRDRAEGGMKQAGERAKEAAREARDAMRNR